MAKATARISTTPKTTPPTIMPVRLAAEFDLWMRDALALTMGNEEEEKGDGGIFGTFFFFFFPFYYFANYGLESNRGERSGR